MEVKLIFQVLQKDVKVEVKFDTQNPLQERSWVQAKICDIIQCPGVGEMLKALVGYGSLVKYWDVGWFSSEPGQRPPNHVCELLNKFSCY